MTPVDQVGDHEQVVSAPDVGEVQQALALVRTLMDRLAAEVAEEPEGRAGREVQLQQALALPRRAAVLRDLSFALQELISLERRQLGLGDERGARLLEALQTLAAGACQPAAVDEARTDGQ